MSLPCPAAWMISASVPGPGSARGKMPCQRRARRWQGIFPLALPGPGTLAEIIQAAGHGKDIAVQGDHHPAREWEAAGATWWLQHVRSDLPVSDIQALTDAGPPRG